MGARSITILNGMLTSQQLNALIKAFRVGKGMTADEAQGLDAGLPGGEQQLEARMMLCGFYRGTRSAESAAAAARHAAWLSTSWLPELPLSRIDLSGTEKALEFFQQVDCGLALAGLARVRGAMPEPRWWRARGDVLLTRARERPEERRLLSEQAHDAYVHAWKAWLVEYERDRKQFESDADRPRRERLLHTLELSAPFTRVRLLTHLIEAAFEAELDESVREHSAGLEPLITGPVASIAAEARHRFEIARGRLALRAKDDATAMNHLLDSTASLAQALLLRYSGPDLKLAQELIAQGHRAIVIEFLERCESASGGLCPRLTEIRRAIEQGDEPDWTPIHAPRQES